MSKQTVWALAFLAVLFAGAPSQALDDELEFKGRRIAGLLPGFDVAFNECTDQFDRGSALDDCCVGVKDACENVCGLIFDDNESPNDLIARYQCQTACRDAYHYCWGDKKVTPASEEVAPALWPWSESTTRS